jgi:hypothetical protein
MNSYFKRHIFFCLNHRENGDAACAQQAAQAGFEHCKLRIKRENMSGPGAVRVNKSGCLRWFIPRQFGTPLLTNKT